MKILLVEDKQKIADAIARGLRRETFAVDVCYDGAAGLAAALGDESYDLIIVDRMLPEVEGLEIVRQVRAAKIQVPILVLTAKGQPQNRVDGLNAGADDYLVKPFSFQELVARVKALMRRPNELHQTVIKFGDLTFNSISYEVRRGRKKIKLTSTELALLEWLMRKPKAIHSKDTLATHVWDFESDILPNTVEAYISSLRRKIDKPFPSKKKLLFTYRGLGYSLGEDA
ncbi:response regulator transcription factor [Candidatus Saccharibacteria bacterium]|nr:response regulator transcription factor [Candidatus Saccharibacteria bacterium]